MRSKGGTPYGVVHSDSKNGLSAILFLFLQADKLIITITNANKPEKRFIP